jgi:hypothetical protein
MLCQGSSPQSLLEYLELSQSNCLNEVEDHNIKGIFPGKTRNTTDSYLLSDVDEQLLLNIYVRTRAYEPLGNRCLRNYTTSSIKLSGSKALSSTLLIHRKDPS